MKPDSRTRVLCKQTYSAAMCVLREAGRKREQQKWMSKDIIWHNYIGGGDQ